MYISFLDHFVLLSRISFLALLVADFPVEMRATLTVTPMDIMPLIYCYHHHPVIFGLSSHFEAQRVIQYPGFPLLINYVSAHLMVTRTPLLSS